MRCKLYVAQDSVYRDGPLVYQRWPGLRCLASLSRTAKGLAAHGGAGSAAFGQTIRTELQRLCPMATEWPTVELWWAWDAIMCLPTMLYVKTGLCARRLQREGEALWVFWNMPSAEPANNVAECAHRCGGLWRKRSQGTCSEKGKRWVERVLSLRHP